MKEKCRDRGAFGSGDVVGFSRIVQWWNPRHWLSWRIQVTTGSPYNHVGLLTWNGRTGEWDVIEALMFGGVSQTPLSRYLDSGRRLTVARRPLSSIERWRLVAFAQSQIGAKYDGWKILKIRIGQLLFGHDAIDALRVADDDRLWICSELVNAAYRKVNHLVAGAYAGPGATMKYFEPYAEWTGKQWVEVGKKQAAREGAA